ncbi:MAG: hypothetical protein AAF416_04460 [Pseudomonadota bacterium]
MKDFDDDDHRRSASDETVNAPKRSFLASPILWLASIVFWAGVLYLVL